MPITLQAIDALVPIKLLSESDVLCLTVQLIICSSANLFIFYFLCSSVDLSPTFGREFEFPGFWP